MKYDIIFSSVGTPKSADPQDIKAFLKVFLGSKRVVDLSRLIWWPLLHLIILKKRPPAVAARYREMIDKLGSNPTFSTSRDMIKHFMAKDSELIKSHLCYALSPESVAAVQEKMMPDSTKVVIPLYPQHSEATYDLIFDFTLKQLNAQGACHFWAKDPFFIYSAKKIENELSGKEVDQLYLSFHSYPVKRIKKGESYRDECEECFEQIRELLPEFLQDKAKLSYQSKFGKGEWLGPLIEEDIFDQMDKGLRSFAVYSPSFLTDSIETSWELGIDLKKKVEERGGTLKFIECLNSDPEWLDQLYSSITKELPQ